MLTETNGFSILFKVTDSNALSRAFPMIIHRSMSSKGKTVGTETFTVYVISNCCTLMGFVLSIICVRKKETRNAVNIISTIVSALWLLLIVGVSVFALFLTFVK